MAPLLCSLITVHCPLQSLQSSLLEHKCSVNHIKKLVAGYEDWASNKPGPEPCLAVLKVRAGEHPSLYWLISNITGLNLILICILWRCIQIDGYNTSGLLWSVVWGLKLQGMNCLVRATISYKISPLCSHLLQNIHPNIYKCLNTLQFSGYRIGRLVSNHSKHVSAFANYHWSSRRANTNKSWSRGGSWPLTSASDPSLQSNQWPGQWHARHAPPWHARAPEVRTLEINHIWNY